jgi:hypothetical protein
VTLSSPSATYEFANAQYTDFTIAAGATVTFPSGTVIRCTGTFTNNGHIIVQTGASGGALSGNIPLGALSNIPADPGVSLRAAGSSEFGESTGGRFGGAGGVGLSAYQARHLTFPGVKAGGSGAGGIGSAGAGGGSLVVLARTAIVNGGTGIVADGSNSGTAGGGGGAGGVVILASAGSITNNAPISVKGGNGGGTDAQSGPGGGGGGGIVRLISPSVTNAGGFVTTGGAGGTIIQNGLTSQIRGGGGGGGACGGNGGNGGATPASPGPSAAPAGGGVAGHGLVDLLDPTFLF